MIRRLPRWLVYVFTWRPYFSHGARKFTASSP